MTEKHKITVIGGAGRMGQWIAETLNTPKHEIHITDKNKKAGLKYVDNKDITFHEDYSSIKYSDIVIVSVPIAITPKIIQEVGPKMKEGSLLMDVTSVKEEPVEAMKKHVPDYVNTIGTHPLFGPQETGFQDKNVVLVPVDSGGCLERVKEYIEKDGGNVRIMSAKEHDKAMAVVQGASHLLLILFGSILKDQEYEIEKNKDLTTPTFQLLLKDLDRVLVQNPSLYASIQTHNNYIPEIHQETIERYMEIEKIIEKGDTEKLSEFIEEIDRYIQREKPS
ncbi:prephenate dehydrogenase/arogenate dehydrogenase family protein [Methanonatronarchaeum sp. AMET-Sl]|uniref:prephenate dehydrogenase/arogenate dehydrogenase family protein n=1 Tax=Methanonatronarchaeum sp. AMET-Sl TaxID=3037654 RepID=UPI00244E07A3|nr:prephenate dehydrogenase/arogenate dehydrogenase family protein [Methanonatronarchaeum sp. AMET-Sl]WGI17988.1 prephenate dehydrogenase/arogenate dehydrogenase family protein [Methanonatronarchaeum sp. AMET-Sl]